MSATMTAAGAEVILDVARLRERTCNDDSIMREVVRIFLSECPRWMEALRVGAMAGDLKVLRLTAHLIGGTAGTCGALKLAGLARRLEEKGKRGDGEGTAELADEILAAAEELEPRMRELL